MTTHSRTAAEFQRRPWLLYRAWPILLLGLLSACDQPTVPAPTPKAEVSSATQPAPKPALDPQSAGSQAKADPKADLSPQEESTAMPKAGQANDHSNVARDPKPTN
jgi:hypothetical protein